MVLIHPFFLEKVIFLLSLGLILASSTLINYEQRRHIVESRQASRILSPPFKYYSNKKGTQVIEIAQNNACQIFQGTDAAWLQQTKGDSIKPLNYIQFRLMVGKCQIDAFLNNRAVYAASEKIDRDSNRVVIDNRTKPDTGGQESELKESSVNGPGQGTKETPTDTNGSNDVNTTEGPKLPLIFPGTKWCGAGSTARSHEDLGIYVETDKCCREHDLCQDNMEGKECKYGLCNDSEFTRSHCECDDKFRTCLQRDKTLSSLASFKIANLYFNILKPLCFALMPPVKRCRRYRITGECIEFEFDRGCRPEWQFFPAQPFLSETVEKLIGPALPSLPPLPIFHPPAPSPAQTSSPTEDPEEEDEDEDENDYERKDVQH